MVALTTSTGEPLTMVNVLRTNFPLTAALPAWHGMAKCTSPSLSHS